MVKIFGNIFEFDLYFMVKTIFGKGENDEKFDRVFVARHRDGALAGLHYSQRTQ